MSSLAVAILSALLAAAPETALRVAWIPKASGGDELWLDASADGLVIASCRVGKDRDFRQAEASAEILLLTADYLVQISFDAGPLASTVVGVMKLTVAP